MFKDLIKPTTVYIPAYHRHNITAVSICPTPYQSRFWETLEPRSLFSVEWHFGVFWKSSTGASVLIRGISAEYTPVPLHIVYLILCLGLWNLEYSFCHHLPGSAPYPRKWLAGDKVVINAIVSEKPSSEKYPDPVEKKIPGLYQACVETRAMSKWKETSDEKVTSADTVISQVFEGERLNPSIYEPVQVFSEKILMKQVEKMSTS